MRSADGAGWVIDGWWGMGGGEFAFRVLRRAAGEMPEKQTAERMGVCDDGLWRDGRVERFKVQTVRWVDVRETMSGRNGPTTSEAKFGLGNWYSGRRRDGEQADDV
jgi:hypothetical protein